MGEMNLWWPKSVPYKRDKPKETQAVWHRASPGATGDAQVPTKTLQNVQLEEDAELPRQKPRRSTHIYPTPLVSHQFRLLRLDPVRESGDVPVHATLETYEIHDCPEYETTSYTWGGEDDDASLCEPVYLGDYWDVLMQTHNCWAMLHYLRPRQIFDGDPMTGCRYVWVDALCINQEDEAEREQQVAQMGTVYQLCMRVVVFLGEDFLTPAGDQEESPSNYRQFRHRRRLPDETLRDLLQLRYFSRVWIIQELLLTPAILLYVFSKL